MWVQIYEKLLVKRKKQRKIWKCRRISLSLHSNVPDLTASFLNGEILHKYDIDAIQLNSDDVELPALTGIIYEYVGIQFEYDGKRYDVTDTAHLTAALASGAPLRWFWNNARCRKYGGSGSVILTALYVDTHGKAVPDVKLSVTKTVTV